MRHQDFFKKKLEEAEDRDLVKFRILEGALRAFSVMGYDDVDIQDIAEFSEVTEAEVYSLYEDKDQAFDDLLFHVASEVSERVERGLTDVSNPIDRVMQKVSQYIDFASYSDTSWGKAFVLRTAGVPLGAQVMRTNLEVDVLSGIRSGDFNVREIEAAFLFISAVLLSAVQYQVSTGADEECTSNACEAILRLLGAPPTEIERVLSTYERREVPIVFEG